MRMKTIAMLLLALVTASFNVLRAQNVAGTWQGTATLGKDQTRIVVKIAENGGQLSGALYTIDEDDGGDPTALSSVSHEGDTLKFAAAVADIAFSGHFNPDGNSIAGTFTAGKTNAPLTFVRANADTAWDIPKPTVMMDKKADPGFEVATIKPAKPEEDGPDFDTENHSVSTTATTLDELIGYAYDVHRTQILGAPGWAASSRYDIAGVPDLPGEPNNTQFKSMMRKLLADRFQLKFHTAKKILPVYILSVARGGPKNLTRSAISTEDDFNIPIGAVRGGLKLSVANGTMTDFAVFGLQGGTVDRPVLDRTGIKGRYDFFFTWFPDLSQFDGKMQMQPDPKYPLPDIFTAMREQLGLNLVPARTQADVLVIDHVESPSPN